jgi:hypothetical protein
LIRSRAWLFNFVPDDCIFGFLLAINEREV